MARLYEVPPLAGRVSCIGQLRARISGRASYTLQLRGHQVAPNSMLAGLRAGEAATPSRAMR